MNNWKYKGFKKSYKLRAFTDLALVLEERESKL